MTNSHILTIRYVVKKDGRYLKQTCNSLLNWSDVIDSAQIYIKRETAELGAKIFGGQVVELQIMEVL